MRLKKGNFVTPNYCQVLSGKDGEEMDIYVECFQ